MMRELGKHEPGLCCLYINKLTDVDEGVLRDVIARPWAHMEEKYR